MSKKLVIVESPHKSKTIEKYLGKDFKVVSSVGHIRDLSTSGKYGFGVDIDNNNLLLSYKGSKAVTPGQFCVLYDKDICLGGGIIKEVK